MAARVPDALSRALHDAARQLTLSRALRASVRSAVWVLTVLTAGSVASFALPFAPPSFLIALTAAAGAAFATAAYIFLRRRTDPVTAARILDARAGLDERASTAIELMLAPGRKSALSARVIADASSHVGLVDVRAALPVKLPRAARWIPALAVLLVVWPRVFGGLALPGTPAHRVHEAIRREGARLEQSAQSLESFARAEQAPLTRRAAPQLRGLGRRLQLERWDRGQALAQIAEMSRQLELAQRQIDRRLEQMARVPKASTSLPPDLFRREAVQRQLRQLTELTSRLPPAAKRASPEVLDRLGTISHDGEGSQSGQVRQQLDQARRQLEEGDTAGARESLTQAMQMLEGMDRMLGDREGVQSAHQQLSRAGAAIASAPSPRSPDDSASAQQAAPPRSAGNERPDAQPGAESMPPPPGPWTGSTPGEGRVADKLGDPTPRRAGPHPSVQVRGSQGDGDVKTSDVLGPGRPGAAQVGVQAVSPALVARVDRALERAHVPIQYRMIVHDYFTRLAGMK